MDEAEGTASTAGALGSGNPTDGHPFTAHQRLAGAAVAAAGSLAIVATLVAAGVRMREQFVSLSWQLLPMEVLRSDPIGGIWYLHTQPPLHNLVVGAVVRWSPFPEMGTLFVLWMATLVATTVVLADVLAGMRLHPVAAGLVATIAMANPNLLSTINIASYEIPVAFLLVCSVWLVQRYLRRPALGGLLAVAGALTALAMTRSLFHPVFVVVVLTLVGVARKATWRQVAVAVAVPLLVVGGWMGKNAVVVDRATSSSWFGFNLQRGVTATMARADVEDDVAAGKVSALALEYPWGPIEQYEPFTGPCDDPYGDHPALTIEMKSALVANFNHACYLAAYDQAADDAEALIARHPGRYLSTRRTVLASSFAMAAVGEGGRIYGTTIDAPTRTWMDAVGDVALLPTDQQIHSEDWNLPLLVDGSFPYRSSVTLLLLSVGLLVRAGWSVVRLARAGWAERDERWRDVDLLWLVVGLAFSVAVLASAMVEFGENGRFRSVLDPFLVALPLGAAVRLAVRFTRPGTKFVGDRAASGRISHEAPR